MTEYLRNQWQNVVSFWNDLSRRQQLIVGGISTITVLVVVGLLYWSMQPQWVVLYNRDMEAQEASKIASELENLGVQYRLDGNVIKVPFSRVERLRLQLAESGIQPTSTVGFEIFEKGGIGITDFERQVRFKRAVQGSLERSIRTNPAVEEAQVHLSIPRRQALFKSEEKPVRASVKLKLRPYESLDKPEVKGIVNLVSYGVVGLDPTNVVVMDQHDRILSDFQDEDGSPSTGKIQQLEVKERIERKLERKLRRSLGRIVTPDRLATAVNVNMDFDRIKKRMEQYRKPDGAFDQLMASEEQEKRVLEGKGIQPGGAAGAESNIPGAEEVDTGGATEYRENSTTVNYFADKNVTTITKDPAITRVSAFVTVDGQYQKNTNENGELVFAYQPLADQKMDKINRLARAAIGYNSDRGDQIEVTNLQFDRTEEIQRRRERQQQQQFQRKVAYFIAGSVGLTLVVGLGVFWWIRRGETSQEVEEVEPEIPSRDLMQEVSIQEKQREEVTDRIRDVAEEHPDTVAQILRTWFAEEA